MLAKLLGLLQIQIIQIADTLTEITDFAMLFPYIAAYQRIMFAILLVLQ